MSYPLFPVLHFGGPSCSARAGRKGVKTPKGIERSHPDRRKRRRRRRKRRSPTRSIGGRKATPRREGGRRRKYDALPRRKGGEKAGGTF